MAPESRAQLYRRKAAEARQAAEKLVNNSTLKTGYLEVAQAWLELAEQAERSDDLVQQ